MNKLTKAIRNTLQVDHDNFLMMTDYFRDTGKGTMRSSNFSQAEYGSSVLAAKTDNLKPFTAIIKGFVEPMVFLPIFVHFLKGGS